MPWPRWKQKVYPPANPKPVTLPVPPSSRQILARKAWLGPDTFAENVTITFDTVIRAVQPGSKEPHDHDSHQVDFLTPGFINAHCHLEYSHLAGTMPCGAIPFGEWMSAIVARGNDDPEHRRHGMITGARQLIAGGCTTVLDSTTDGSSEAILVEAGLRTIQFHEVLGLTRERAEPILSRALEFTRLPGHYLNPHAPYSVGPWLRQQLRTLPRGQFPQAWHLAESADEDELFRHATGSIADFLRRFGLPFPYEEMPGVSPAEFLQREGLMDDCDLAFHGNQLSDREAAWFTAPRGLVHCPGTQRWFQRSPAPLRKWLDAGVNLCLGTDSLASSDSLSMLANLHIAAKQHPDITSDELLRMVCWNPAQVSLVKNIGLTGTLEPGALADFVALTSQTGHTSAQWEDVLLSPTGRVEKVWIGGEVRS